MRAYRITAAAALIAAGAALAGGRVAARHVTEQAWRMAEQARVSLGAIHFAWLGPLRLERVELPAAGGVRVTAEAVRVGWRLAGGADPRAHVARVVASGLRVQRGQASVLIEEVAFDVLQWDRQGAVESVRLRQRPHGGTLQLRWDRRQGARAAHVELDAIDLASAEVRWRDRPVLRPGRWSGRLDVSRSVDAVRTSGALTLAGASLSLAPWLGEADAARGAPTDLQLDWSASSAQGALDVQRLRARSDALDVSARGRLTRGGRFEAAVDAATELGGGLRTAGLRLPEPLDARQDAPLGTARFQLTAEGVLNQPAAWRLAPRLSFTPEPAALEAFQFLRRPFHFQAQPAALRIDVSAGAPEFVPLPEVPPLFVRMLLVSEDAGFFGHPGVDVAEIPAAWAENVERGRLARGASTITQQLARNLFLSREKSYARKVEEAALALMLDAAVPKARILEIYLNVIEWGPGLHGLGPAARHYFGKHPWQLTTREMAFLVCVIPSPVRYHSAHRAGHAGPGMEQLMQNLLARLRSLDALTEEEYQHAAADELLFAPEPGLARTAG
jgi:hypothetical protein